jgi:hypothetical protein
MCHVVKGLRQAQPEEKARRETSQEKEGGGNAAGPAEHYRRSGEFQPVYSLRREKEMA